jgi:hypothetical protein
LLIDVCPHLPCPCLLGFLFFVFLLCIALHCIALQSSSVSSPALVGASQVGINPQTREMLLYQNNPIATHFDVPTEVLDEQNEVEFHFDLMVLYGDHVSLSLFLIGIGKVVV